MRHVFVISLVLSAGCQSGTLKSGEWGTLRYFGQMEGVVPVRDTEEDRQEPLVVVPPMSDRDGNIYVLNQRLTKDSAVYVGNPYGGWSPGCHPNDVQLPNAVDDDPPLRGFLGTSTDMAWYWSGDALVEVSGNTGACKQVLNTDPFELFDLSFVAAVPYVHETPARRTVVSWVQSTEATLNREPPKQVVVDLDLKRYVTEIDFDPTDATCVEVLGVGANPAQEEGVVVVAYNRGLTRFQEARFLNPMGNTTKTVTLDMGITAYFDCNDSISDSESDMDIVVDRPEPMLVGQMQSNDEGIYAGLLQNGELLSFSATGGGSKELPNFSVEGMVKFNGELWVTGVADNQPVVGRMNGVGSVNDVVRWEASRRAASNLTGLIKVLDERYSPAEPLNWDSPVTAMGSFPLMSPFPLDTYAIETTGWLVGGPSFESGKTRTAIAFGPVGMTVP